VGSRRRQRRHLAVTVAVRADASTAAAHGGRWLLQRGEDGFR
jgi:hypothetical protein